jgi:hypothetical protein
MTDVATFAAKHPGTMLREDLGYDGKLGVIGLPVMGDNRLVRLGVGTEHTDDD